MRTWLLAMMVVCGFVNSSFAADPMPATAAKPWKKFDGFWKPVAIEFDGQPQFPKDATLDDYTLVIKDGEYRLYIVKEKATDQHLRLATAMIAAEPFDGPEPELKPLKLRIESGPRKGTLYHGIYKLTETELTLCYTAASEPRPTQLSAKAGSKAFLEQWTIEKLTRPATPMAP